MFMGEFEHSLDAKGRLIVPVKFREALGEHFVITKGLDECLFIFPKDEWKILEDKLKTLPLSDTNARRFVRFFFSGAVECEKDSQGRVLLPVSLRKYAGLSKEVVSIGVVNRIEIWSKDAWENYNDATNFVDSSLAEKMAELGI